jgi:hypothetical protein
VHGAAVPVWSRNQLFLDITTTGENINIFNKCQCNGHKIIQLFGTDALKKSTKLVQISKTKTS